ncbi:MAG: hypothetical protein WAV47_22570 [Blastocatellia bacterium]
MADSASTGTFPIFNLVEFSTPGTDDDILRMTDVLRKQVTWEEVEFVAAVIAAKHFNPKEILDWCVGSAVYYAAGTIEITNVVLQRRPQISGRASVRRKIQMLDLLANNPPSHRVDVEADGCAPGSVRLN